ncbi:MAG: Sua5/YciO/YrdC/YwlC family protein [Mollicutes bacterium PWAP]|nr:Sua5/YciO/YrdC/YwlC family protein [Mollicutes bacterium PWAP]
MNKYKNIFIATTDTILGIGAPIKDSNKELIYELKKRPKAKNLIIMISSLEMGLKNFENIFTDKAIKYAKKYWPGNTTLVFNDDIAIRIPNNNKLIKMIDEIGPIFMTSANISGEKNYSLKKAKKVFKDKITNFYDFGKMSGKSSKIIDIRTGKFLR